MTPREFYVHTLKTECVCKPYLWGAKGPDAFDCSGVVTWCLRKAGFNIDNICSSALAEKFENNYIGKSAARPGCLYFYGRDRHHITHVMSVAERWRNGTTVLIGARGGTSETTDLEQAYSTGAFVDACMGDYWASKFQFAADPFEGVE